VLRVTRLATLGGFVGFGWLLRLLDFILRGAPLLPSAGERLSQPNKQSSTCPVLGPRQMPEAKTVTRMLRCSPAMRKVRRYVEQPRRLFVLTVCCYCLTRWWISQQQHSFGGLSRHLLLPPPILRLRCAADPTVLQHCRILAPLSAAMEFVCAINLLEASTIIVHAGLSSATSILFLY